MASQEENDRDLRLSRSRNIDSPFAEGDLFVRETDAEWEVNLAALEAESPFRHAFKQGRSILNQPEVLEEEFADKWADADNFPVDEVEVYDEEELSDLEYGIEELYNSEEGTYTEREKAVPEEAVYLEEELSSPERAWMKPEETWIKPEETWIEPEKTWIEPEEEEETYPLEEAAYKEDESFLDGRSFIEPEEEEINWPIFESEQGPAIPSNIAEFAANLGREWARRRNGSPSSGEITKWLLQDYQDTQEGARLRWKNNYNKGKYTAEAISRAWMVSRQENMKFQTSSSAGVKSLRNFDPPASSATLVSSNLINGSDKAPVAPIVVRFVEELRQRYSGFMDVSNYRGHGGGSFLNRGYSLDLFLKDLDDRRFYPHEEALKFMRAVQEAARAIQAEWRVIYNDFYVAETINRETGKEHIIFVGKAMKDKNKRVSGLNWHGPDPLILHFHLDLAPQTSTSDVGNVIPSATPATPTTKPPQGVDKPAEGLVQFAQRVQQLLGGGAFSLSLLGRFASGQIWNEDHLALEILFNQQSQLRPANLDILSGSNRLELLRSLAIKFQHELTPIRERIVRPIFGNPANFQIGSERDCKIHNLRETVMKLGPLPGGKNKRGETWYKKDARASPRKQAVIDSIVLHHMAYNIGNDLNSYKKVGAHYIVTADGQIAQLYDDLDFLNASNGFNTRSISIEFAGNFYDHRYHWWKSRELTIPDRCYLTPAQIRAGRCLLKTLRARLPSIKYLYAHRQSSEDREGDPGPDVWFNIGEWALNNLNLTDRLPSTHIGTGKPIPEIWRRNRAAISETTVTSTPVIPIPKLPQGMAKPPAELVRFVQWVLNVVEGERLAVDGDFGSLTRGALERFRNKYNLGKGGVLDDKVQLALAQRALEEIAQQSTFAQPGVFDAKTEQALISFKLKNGLGWNATLDEATRAALINALGRRASAPTTPIGSLDRITQVAAESQIARYKWRDRGVAPPGYIKGMALAYARVYCKVKAGDAAATEIARANTGNTDKDVLAHYAQEFNAAGMSNELAGVDTLRHLFVLLIGLGMRESSGHYCAGRDRSASNTTAETAEAGLFQTSYNARKANSLMSQLFRQYSANPSGFVEVFREGVKCRDSDLENFGEGDGREFQRLSKACPTFAAEFAAVGLRNVRKYWGPINRKAAEIRPECDAMLMRVQKVVDEFNLCQVLR